MKTIFKNIVMLKISMIFFSSLYARPKEDNIFWKDLQAILIHHPKVQKQVLELSAKMESYHYKKIYYPDPKFGIVWSNVPYNKSLKFRMNRTPMSGVEYSIRQPIPFPGKLSLIADIEEKEVDLERVKLAILYNSISKNILKNYISYYYWDQIAGLTRNYLQKFKIITVSSKAKYATGKGSLTDFTKAVLLEKRLKENLTNFSGYKNVYQEKLEYYFSTIQSNHYKKNSYFKETIKYIDQLYNKQKPSIENLVRNSTLYRFAKILPQIQRKKLKLEEYDYYPDFELFLSYRSRSRVDNDPVIGEDFMSAGITIRLPLWSAFSNPDKVRSREQLLESSRRNLSEVKLDIKTQIQALQVDIDVLSRRLKQYKKELIPQAQLAYISAMQNYRVGTIDYEALSMIWMDLYNLNKEKLLLERDLLIKKVEYLEIINHILPEIDSRKNHNKEKSNESK